MTRTEQILLGLNIGAGALGSAVGARQQGQQTAQNEADLRVQRMLEALQNQQATSADLQQNRQQGWKDQTSQSPLGQEQSFLQKQRLAQVLFPQISKFQPAGPTDPGVAGAFRPQSNVLGAFGDPRFLETFGDQATATSLADRRKLMAGLNPDYEFSSLGNFGLDSSFDQGVNRAQSDAAARRSAYENTQSSLANQQYQLAQGQTTQGQMGQNKKGGGIGGFLGGVLKTAAPFAAFIPGVGPLAAIGLGAAGGALGNKLQGGSLVSGALQGGASAGIGAAGRSLASGQGLNPFNNARAVSGVVPGTSMTQLMADAAGKPNFSIPPAANAAGDIQNLLGQPQSSFRQLPQAQAGGGGSRPSFSPESFQIPQGQMGFGQTAPKGASPQGYPLAAAGPYTGPGSTPFQIGPNPDPSAVRASLQQRANAGQQLTPEELQQAFGPAALAYMNQQYPDPGQALAGVMAGLPGLGANIPGAIGRSIPANAPNVAMNVGRMGRAAELGTASRNAAFDSVWKQAVQSPARQSAAAETMMAMGRMGTQMPAQAQGLNQAAQNIFKSIPGQIKQQLTPQQLQQIVLALNKGAK